jgi:hypothetical protein
MSNYRNLFPVIALCLALGACAKEPAPTTGEIGGRLEFPSDEVPAMTIVLLEMNNPEPIKIKSPAKRATYAVSVPPGRYIVYAIPDESPDPLLVGAHTDYSLCDPRVRSGEVDGERCRTSPPREVSVVAGARVTDAHIDDWYLEEQVAMSLLALANRDR